MTLRRKTLFAIATTLVSLNAVLYFLSSTIILKNAKNAENQYVERTVHEAINLLIQSHQGFIERWSDWEAWDEPYQYLIKPNQEFELNNLQDFYLRSKANLVIFADLKGRLIFSKSFDPNHHQTSDIPTALKSRLVVQDLLFAPQPQIPQPRTGFILLPKAPLFVLITPSLRSNWQGPSHGTLFWGHYLTNQDLKKLAQLFHLDLTLYPYNSPQLPSDFLQARSVLLKSSHLSPTDNIFIQSLNTKQIAGYTLLKDIDGKPALLLRSLSERTIYQRSQQALRFLIVISLSVGLVFCILTLGLLESLVLRRLTYLNNAVTHIGQQGDLSSRITLSGRDELSSLTDSINQMLQELEQHEQQQRQIQMALKEAKELAESAREQSESLLLNILPKTIAEQLKQESNVPPTYFQMVSILFADIVGFTNLAAKISPTELVDLLGAIFSKFDRLTEQYKLEKIKTIGDAYMVAGGLPIPQADHASAIAQMALDMQQVIQEFDAENYGSLQIRIGINTGPVVAGVIGTKKFIYDLWGDTVNVASRMESQGLPGRIQVTATTYDLLKDQYIFEERGMTTVKGKGEMQTYWLICAQDANDLER